MKNLVSSSPLVTLTGVGGVGKTRVALRVASNSQGTFEDGVWLIELGELRILQCAIASSDRGFELRNFLTCERQRHSIDVVVQMCHRRGSRDGQHDRRAPQQPGQGQLGR